MYAKRPLHQCHIALPGRHFCQRSETNNLRVGLVEIIPEKEVARELKSYFYEVEGIR